MNWLQLSAMNTKNTIKSRGKKTVTEIARNFNPLFLEEGKKVFKSLSDMISDMRCQISFQIFIRCFYNADIFKDQIKEWETMGCPLIEWGLVNEATENR